MPDVESAKNSVGCLTRGSLPHSYQLFGIVIAFHPGFQQLNLIKLDQDTVHPF